MSLSEIPGRFANRAAHFHKLEDAMAKGQDLPSAAASIIERMGNVRVTFDSAETEVILRVQPIILAANHAPNVPLALLPALIFRGKDDVYMFGNAALKNALGPRAADKFLPVYTASSIDPGLHVPNRNTSAVNLLRSAMHTNLSRDQAHAKNMVVVERATDLVSEGGLVSIVPDGGIGDNWKSGIGKIAQGVLRKNSEAYIIGAQIEGTLPTDYLRMTAPRLTRRLMGDFLPTVHFSLLRKIGGNNDPFLHMEPRDVASALQALYSNAFHKK